MLVAIKVSYMEGNTNTPCTPVEGAEALKIRLGCSVAKTQAYLQDRLTLLTTEKLRFGRL